MQKPSYVLADFEGPLELLLFLVQKHKLNILDIELSVLIDQYLAFIAAAPQEDAELASEFLEMAARLLYIKTVSLLPKHEEETQTLKSELTGELVEYQACRQAAEWLRGRYRGGESFVRRPLPLPKAAVPYALSHEPGLLAEAYLAATGRGKRRRPPPPESFVPLVAAPIVPVTARIAYILRALKKSDRLSLRRLFAASVSKSELVATFIALLELVKGGRVRLSDDDETAFLAPDFPALHAGTLNTTAVKEGE